MKAGSPISCQNDQRNPLVPSGDGVNGKATAKRQPRARQSGEVENVDDLRRREPMPSDLALEGDILGALLCNSSSAGLLANVPVESFNGAENRTLAAAIKMAHLRGLPTDVGTVSDILRETIPGPKCERLVSYAYSLSSGILTGAQLPVWLPRLERLAAQRDMILIGDTLTKAGYQRGDPAEWADHTEHFAKRLRGRTGAEQYSIEALDSATFFQSEFVVEYLVDQCLPAGQNCVFGGREKTLKTSIGIELACSLASATPFLGVFNVPKAVPVGFISGESGKVTIQAKARQVCEAKQVDPMSLPIKWCFRLPQLGDPTQLSAVERLIQANGLRALFIDPLYLCLLRNEAASNASNLFAMGAALSPLSEIVESTGCTIVVMHHFRKGSATDRQHEPAELTQLAMSGTAEWARSWILLSRRSAWEPGSPHELWMNVGGSAGHASLLAVDIDEGETGVPGGRYWNVKTEDGLVLRSESRKRGVEDDAIRLKQELEKQSPEQWWTLRAMRKLVSMGAGKIKAAASFLQQKNLLESRPSLRNGNDTHEYRIRR
jgi:hypothetical protein